MTLQAETAARARPPLAVSRLVQALSRYLGVLAVLAMLISVNIEVVGRSFFGHATIWVTEVSTYLVVAITFLGAAFVAGRDGNVRVDILLNRFSTKTRDALRPALTWIALFTTLILFWKVTGFWSENYESGARSWSLLNTPLWIPQTAAVAGLAGLILALAFSNDAKPGLPALFPVFAALVFAALEASGSLPFNLSPIHAIAGLGLLAAAGAALSGGTPIIVVSGLILIPVTVTFVLSENADLAIKSASLIGVLFYLLFAGLPVVFSLLAIGIFAMMFWLPPVSLNTIGERAWEAVNTFELAAIPMFVLMGAILVRSNASTEMFTAARKGMGRLRGSLAHASIIASGIFAAVSGSSLATAATMGRVAGPEMMRHGYRPELAYGVLAAGGTLGILIPPSIAMIVYGPMAGVPVTDLFMAGIVPGLMMIAAFSLVVLVWGILDRSAAPGGQSVPIREKLVTLKGVVPFLVLMALVLGSLYAGIATPTEAGAVGVLGAILISFARRTLSLPEFIAALEEAVVATSFLLIIAVGAAVMSFPVDFLSMPQALVTFVQSLDLSDIGLFIAIVILYLILGMFVEPISMVLMTLPIILPVIEAAGWDLLWFGIVLVMLVEIGLITPPVGMILYVLSGVSEGRVTLGQISIGTLPFVGAFLAMVFLFFALPELVTFLPELMR
ncbi:MAG: TRAP transporter large permease subunit [Pseudomonadota bacterium]